MTTVTKKKNYTSPTQKTPEQWAAEYRRSMDRAVTLLSVAKTFAEDGAPTDAMVRAQEAIKLMEKARAARECAFLLGGKR